MRILHVAEAFGGGVLEVVRILANRQVDAGHSVAVAYGTRPQTPQRVSDQFDDRVSLFPLPWARRRLSTQLRAATALRRVVRSWHPELVHLHSSFAGLVGAITPFGSTPTVYTPHCFSFLMDAGRAQKWAYRNAERFVSHRVSILAGCSVSEASLAKIALDAPRVVAVPNGIPELDETSDRDSQSRNPKVVCLGRMEAQRQPEACARILESLVDLAELEWIGSGTGSRQLETAGVGVTGWLPHAEALARLSDALAYLHWTAWDGLPLSVLEAMARDVVVVASDIPANRELLGDEQVCSREADASHLLRRAMTDLTFRDRCITNQRKRRANYSAKAMVLAYHDLYERLLEGELGGGTPQFNA